MSKIQEELEKIRSQATELHYMRKAFAELGNDALATRLLKITSELNQSVQAIQDEEFHIINECVRQAEQNSVNVLGAVWGGMDLAKRESSEHLADLEAVVEYLFIDDREQKDFEGHLGDGGVEPMPGIERADWDRHLTAWLNAERGTDDESRELEWLALNGDGHIYCNSARLALVTNEKKEVE